VLSWYIFSGLILDDLPITIRSTLWEFTKDTMHSEATVHVEILTLHGMSFFDAISSSFAVFSSITLRRFLTSFLSDFVSKKPYVDSRSMHAKIVIFEANFFANCIAPLNALSPVLVPSYGTSIS